MSRQAYSLPTFFSIELSTSDAIATLKEARIHGKKLSGLRILMSTDIKLRKILHPSLTKTLKSFNVMKNEDKNKKLYFFGDKVQSVFRKKLSTKKCLTQLSGFLPFSHDMTDFGLHCLKNTLLNLKNIEKIHLKLGGIGNSGVTQNGLKKVAHGLSFMTKAESVQINMFWGQKYVQHQVAQSLANSISRLKRVNVLSVKLPGSYIKDESLYEIFNVISSYKKLRELILDFSFCLKLTDSSVKNIVPILSNMKSVRVLDTSFVGCRWISGDGFTELFQGVSSNAQLERLSLRLLCLSRVTDDFMANLSTLLLKLRNLNEIHMVLGRCDKISNRGIIKLGKALAELRSFETLTLDLYASEKINCEGVANFFVALGASSSFKVLKLNIWRQLYNENFYELMQAMSRLTGLTGLEINLFYLNAISDEEIAKLGSGVTMPDGLEHLTIRLTECRNISPVAIYELKQRLLTHSSHAPMVSIEVHDDP